MKNTRLSSLLNRLNNKEMKLLHKWVCSPFFNQRKDVVDLFELYQRHRNLYQDVPSKKQIFNTLYKQEKYDDHKVRLVMSLLYKQSCSFLIHQLQQENPLEYKLNLAKVFHAQKATKDFNRTLKELKMIHQRTPFKDTNYYYNEYRIFDLEYEHTSNISRNMPYNAQAVLDNFDIHFIIKKLQQYLIIYSHKEHYKLDFDLGLIPLIINYVKTHPQLLDYPAIALNFYYIQIVNDDVNPELIENFVALLKKHSEDFSKKETRDFYLIALNYYVKLFNQGNYDIIPQLFDMYQDAINKGLFLVNNKIAHYSFRNIVGIGLIAKKDKWVAQFIKKYNPYLDENIKDVMVAFNLARLASYRRQHDKALDFLMNVHFKETSLMLSKKTLEAKIYYEMKSFDLLDSHLTAMQTFIRRKEIHPVSKSAYLGFALFLQKIIKANVFDKTTKQRLLKEFEQSEHMVDRYWVAEIINKLHS